MGRTTPRRPPVPSGPGVWAQGPWFSVPGQDLVPDSILDYDPMSPVAEGGGPREVRPVGDDRKPGEGGPPEETDRRGEVLVTNHPQGKPVAVDLGTDRVRTTVAGEQDCPPEPTGRHSACWGRGTDLPVVRLLGVTARGGRVPRPTRRVPPVTDGRNPGGRGTGGPPPGGPRGDRRP